MTELPFDVCGLVVPSGGAIPLQPANVRPNNRFEDHLGQAARPASKSSKDTQAPAPDAEAESSPAMESNDDSRRESSSADMADNRAQRKTDETVNVENHSDPLSKDVAAIAPANAQQTVHAKPSLRRSELHVSESAKVVKNAERPKVKTHRDKTTNNDKPAAAKPQENHNSQQTTKVNVPKGNNKKLDEDAPLASEVAIEKEKEDESDTPPTAQSRTEQAESSATRATIQTATKATVQTATKIAKVQSADKQVESKADARSTIAATKPNEPPQSNDATTIGKGTRRPKSPDTAPASAPQRIAADVGTESPAAAAADAVAQIHSDTSAAAESTPNENGQSVETAPSSDDKRVEPRQTVVPGFLSTRHEKPHEGSGRGEGLTEAERVRFVQRVAKAFHTLGDEAGEVRLRLSPPELGSLRLELTVREGALTARLETETAAARNLLLDNLPALRERLAEQNIKVERFDVDVRDEHRQPSREPFAGQGDVPRQGQRQRQRAYDARTVPIVPAVTRAAISRDGTGELNIVI